MTPLGNQCLKSVIDEVAYYSRKHGQCRRRADRHQAMDIAHGACRLSSTVTTSMSLRSRRARFDR